MNRQIIQRRKLQMRTSRKLTHVLFAVFTLALMSVAALAQPGNVGPVPGSAIPASSEASDMKQGALLVYNYYNSDASNVSAIDTKINITNTNVTSSTVVHFFFVSQACSVADFKTELTQSQTYSFLVSDFDPDTKGYIMAVAEAENGLPIAANYLIGDLFVKSSTGPVSANLGAIAFAALWDGTNNGNNPNAEGFWPIPGGDATTPSVNITFGGNYNSLPRTLAVDNIPSYAGGDRTLLVLLTPVQSFVTGGGAVGTLFGLLYDDAEQSQSFQISGGSCQSATVISDSFPRTAPRFTTVVPAGRTGWMKVYKTSDLGILGSAIVYNIGGRDVNFHGGHNLHHLTYSGTQTATLPVFPFELQTN